MKWPCVFLVLIALGGRCFRCVTGDLVTSDEHTDIGHDEDVHPHSLREADGDVVDVNFQTSRDEPPDTSIETNWDELDINQEDYEDADWRPPSVLQDTRPVPSPGDTPGIPAGAPGGSSTDQIIAASSPQCGEYSGRLTSAGECRLVATLPPVGTSQERCPDMFRCTEDVSYWLDENQDRKDKLEELRGTMSELQVELRSHRLRVQALEEQEEQRASLNSSVEQRLRSLELRHATFHTLLHVHAALLDELQAQRRNLSAAVQRLGRSPGSKVKVVRTTPPRGLRDTPGGQLLSLCPSDCASLYHHGVRRSGVYSIVMATGANLPVYCDMETEGGGWTVFQRRFDGSVTFNRGWSDYREGFGDPGGEHWLGNQQLHLLSNQGQHSLRVDLQDWSHAHRHALYHSFRTEGEENRYRLHVSGFTGTAEDSFGWYHDHQGFSTPDTGNICAEISHSGWWFRQCFHANLNGVYYKGGRYTQKAQNLLGPDGIVWFSWKDSDFYSLKAVAMMIRPRSFRPSPLSP
ncbi:fibrinogen C domain-containing protein 1-like [Limanda limanda]|uniref:fibrinogen C domain-containing protein 1-like n=1 Tax=Limanda limanda TaxID=27771 RepID=UPI0029C6D131|nr:fibrinogen C domain-containing protein 1-like [Limanda limanda]